MTLTDVSNPDTVFKRAKQIFGDSCLILPSTNKDKNIRYLIGQTENLFILVQLKIMIIQNILIYMGQK